MISCSERVKHIYPKNVYQIRETLFDQLNSIRILYTKQQALFKNLAVFDFESTFVREEGKIDTDTRKWIGKNIPISVSISSNPVEQPIFLCSADPHYLVASSIAALDNLDPRSKVQMKTLFFDIETPRKNLDWIKFGKLSVNVITNVDKSLKLELFVFKKTVMTAALLLNSSNCRKVN